MCVCNFDFFIFIFSLHLLLFYFFRCIQVCDDISQIYMDNVSLWTAVLHFGVNSVNFN